MEKKLAEAIIEACGRNGLRTELRENYSAPWMRGRKTTGVVIEEGDLGQVLTAIIADAQLFVEGELPKFAVKERLRFSPFRLNLILY